MYNKHILITCPCNIITHKIAEMPIIRANIMLAHTLFFVYIPRIFTFHKFTKSLPFSLLGSSPYHIRLSVITVHRPCPTHWLNPCPSFTSHRAVATAVSFDNSFLPGRSLPPSDVFSHTSTRHSEVQLSVTSHCTSFHSFCLLIPPIQS